MRKPWLNLALAMILAPGCWLFAACGNNEGCVSGATGNSFGGIGGCVAGGSVSGQLTFDVVGDVGTRFNATISDKDASYNIVGNVPLSVVLVNSHPPIKMSATKTTNDSSLLSLNLVLGISLVQVASTSAPFGTIFVQTNPLPKLGPPAAPDVRFFVSAPLGETFETLVEDTQTGFDINSTVPSLILYESPQGKVDGQFIQDENQGVFEIDLIVNGTVVADTAGSPNISLRQP